MKAGKARYIGISNCFAWQIAKANVMAQNKRSDASKKHVWTTGAQTILGDDK